MGVIILDMEGSEIRLHSARDVNVEDEIPLFIGVERLKGKWKRVAMCRCQSKLTQPPSDGTCETRTLVTVVEARPPMQSANISFTSFTFLMK